MASDATYSPSAASIRDAVNHHYVAASDAGHVPGFDWSQRLAHWALRIPLAGIMLVYGLEKFPDMFVAPGAYGVPAVLFILAAIAELLGPVALAIGGMIETWRPRQGWLRLSGDIFNSCRRPRRDFRRTWSDCILLLGRDPDL